MHTSNCDRWVVAKIEPDDAGWRLMIMATHGLDGDPVKATCYLNDFQVDRLHLDEQACNWPIGCYADYGDSSPCTHPALPGSNWCGSHSAVTAGLDRF